MPPAYHRPLLVAAPSAIGLFWSLPLACHRSLLAAALVRGLPARVSRFWRFAERPSLPSASSGRYPACHRPLLVAALAFHRPLLVAAPPAIGLFWSLPLAYHRPLLVAAPPAIGLFWSLPLACHRPLLAAALVRGLPARVSRFRRFAERPSFLPFL